MSADQETEDDAAAGVELTEEEIQHYSLVARKALDHIQIDEDGNGRIQADDLLRLAQAIGYNPTHEHALRMKDFVNRDRDGEIEFREFLKLMCEYFGRPEDEEFTVREALETMDKDGSGYIDSNEFKTFMLEKGNDCLTEDEVQSIFDEYDVNDDGKLDIKELSRMLCRQQR